MGPYRGENVRYHLEDFRRASSRQLRAPRSSKEKFNYYHSSCRNIIERTFGVWKARWNILHDMPYYHIDTQREIVLVTMAVHKYIRKTNVSDEAFQIAEDENYSGEEHSHEATTGATNVEEENTPRNAYWMALRDSLAMDIAGRV
ncbi:PREDICTED: uncharacterized protein LOC105966382 [Erythranthe guttata]|uniref:uncharacterized protein LOC105966382 n=1 Tax=Erythranthe guttata TaxID=4155 RepID=UPI00064DB3C5|nr:PREDICTED: uncharacterized protein LOC105966382 [Erythranthe guttata]|eukprot:XP_012846396.1 PREDICTED: uncharacterized protein LOC105966382 [Erythranthe guttata]